MGFSNHNHLTSTLLFLALSKVFHSCWNEQKYPLTRMEEVFITLVEKQTAMCLCGVTGCSGQFTPTSSVKVVTGRVRSRFSLSRTLLESTGHWDPASGHSPLSVRLHQTKSPWSNELTGLCASVRSHRNQRSVSISPSIHFQLSIIRE